MQIKAIVFMGLLALCGCAARVFKVPLTSTEVVSAVADIKVQDARLDPQIYMTGISMESTSTIYILTPEPPLDVTLRRLIQAKLPNSTGIQSLAVRIERLDLKNKVGFAKADELYCEMESSVMHRVGDASVSVRTFARNVENMSPLVVKSARLILQQCLEQHAQDIVQQSVGATIDKAIVIP